MCRRRCCSDSLGFNDVGFTVPLGSQPEALTPFMDNLVRTEGRLLTHHYVYRLCAPTRAMLLTGRYPGHGIWQQLPGFTGEQGLNLTLPLIPAVLKQAHYSTHQVGKCERTIIILRTVLFSLCSDNSSWWFGRTAYVQGI